MIVNSRSKAEALLKKLDKASLVSVDTETISLTDKTLVAFSVSYDNDDIRYVIPVSMSYIKNLDKSQWLKILKSSCYRDGVVYHNYSFDCQVLYPIIPQINDYKPHDTMVISHLINEHGSHALKKLVKKHLDYKMLTFKEVCGTGRMKVSFADLMDDEIIEKYAGDDALMTKRLFRELYPLLLQTETSGLEYAYEFIERPLLNVVADMHLSGIHVNKSRVEQIANFCKGKCIKFKSLIDKKMVNFDVVTKRKGHPIVHVNVANINSPLHLRAWFIDKQGMPVYKRSWKTGDPSVDSEVLQRYAQSCKEAQWILDYRKYSKILSTFIPALTPESNGRIYPTFRQVGTTSGRFSSASPNFQNIPKNKEDKLDLRACITAPRGKILVGADYSQMELRLAAHYSKDKAAIEAYSSGIDMHKITVDATGLERRKAKVVNFGMLYSMGVKTLAKAIDTSVDEASNFMDTFFSTYPGFLEMRGEVKRELFENGYIELWGGRRRRLSKGFQSKDDYQREAELRSITNALIQGSGASIIKKAMVLMFKELQKYDAKIVAQVHDELIVECPKNNVQPVMKIVERCMVEPTKDMRVPFTVDIKSGKSWKNIH